MKRFHTIALAALLVVSFLAGPGATEEKKYDVVVIGAGGGGLAAAAKLSLAGEKVALLEQHYKAGGYMGSFQRDDYNFEISLHAINGLDPETGMTADLFRELGIMEKVEPIKLDPAYTIITPDFTIEVPADPELYKQRLIELFPHEQKGINKLFKKFETIAYAIQVLRARQSGDGGRALAMIAKKPGFLMPFVQYQGETMSELLDDCVQDEKLKAVLSWMCGYGGAPPERMPASLYLGMMASYHWNGYYYFEGGSQSVVDALLEVIEDNGGEIFTSTMATKILLEDGRAVGVEVESGEVFPCDYVISNASAPATLFELVGTEHLPIEYTARVKSMEVGPSIFQVYLGVDRDYTEYFKGSHTISIFDDYDAGDMIDAHEPETQGYFLVNYSVVDEKAAPAGKNVIGITTYLPYGWEDGWREEESYQKYTEFKNEVAMTFVKRTDKILPGLSEHVEVMEVGSPRTMEHFTLNPKGAVYGWAINVEQMDNRLEQQTPIENLILAGAWTRPGHGQASVMTSGLNAAKMVLGE